MIRSDEMTESLLKSMIGKRVVEMRDSMRIHDGETTRSFAIVFEDGSILTFAGSPVIAW